MKTHRFAHHVVVRRVEPERRLGAVVIDSDMPCELQKMERPSSGPWIEPASMADGGEAGLPIQGAHNGPFVFRSRCPRLRSYGNSGSGIFELRQESQELIAALQSFADQPVRGERESETLSGSISPSQKWIHPAL